MQGMDGVEEYKLEIKAETPNAFLLTDGAIEEWFPKSQIDWSEPDHVGATTEFYIPNWLAEEKGLI